MVKQISLGVTAGNIKDNQSYAGSKASLDLPEPGGL